MKAVSSGHEETRVNSIHGIRHLYECRKFKPAEPLGVTEQFHSSHDAISEKQKFFSILEDYIWLE